MNDDLNDMRQSFPGVELRLATAHDEANLLALTNDPVVRQFSFSRHRVAPDAHHRWLSERLRSSDVIMWIAARGDELIGTIRYEREGEAATISFAVAPGARGKGVGRWLLASTWKPAVAKLGADRARGIVMTENEASARSFLKAGFTEVCGWTVAGRECRVFEASLDKLADETAGTAGGDVR